MILAPVSDDDLDRAFAALADPVRRAIIARLSRGAATVNELAEPFEISKQAVSRHIRCSRPPASSVAAATPSVVPCTWRRPGSRR